MKNESETTEVQGRRKKLPNRERTKAREHGALGRVKIQSVWSRGEVGGES